jgi:ketosteroid isomerase-like protein
MAHHAPDMVTFDLMPLQCLGADAYRKNFEAWFASVQGPIDYEIRDLRLTRRDDVAFCHYLGRVKSTRATGQKTDYWVRATMGLQKMNGQWMVTHEHVSVPFNKQGDHASCTCVQPPLCAGGMRALEIPDGWAKDTVVGRIRVTRSSRLPPADGGVARSRRERPPPREA